MGSKRLVPRVGKGSRLGGNAKAFKPGSFAASARSLRSPLRRSVAQPIVVDIDADDIPHEASLSRCSKEASVQSSLCLVDQRAKKLQVKLALQVAAAEGRRVALHAKAKSMDNAAETIGVKAALQLSNDVEKSAVNLRTEFRSCRDLARGNQRSAKLLSLIRRSLLHVSSIVGSAIRARELLKAQDTTSARMSPIDGDAEVRLPNRKHDDDRGDDSQLAAGLFAMLGQSRDGKSGSCRGSPQRLLTTITAQQAEVGSAPPSAGLDGDVVCLEISDCDDTTSCDSDA